jgi:hypothetical protein
LEALLEGWGEQTAVAAAGRHVLAIQDTSEINFRTKPERRRGLGEIGKGTGHGLLLHAMAAVDADSDACLGLVAGKIWTRQGRVTVPHDRRPLDVEPQQVVPGQPDSADGGLRFYPAVRAMPVVSMEPTGEFVRAVA